MLDASLGTASGWSAPLGPVEERNERPVDGVWGRSGAPLGAPPRKRDTAAAGTGGDTVLLQFFLER